MLSTPADFSFFNDCTATSTSFRRMGWLSSVSVWGQFSTDGSLLALWLYSSEQYSIHRFSICRSSVRHFPERSWTVLAFPCFTVVKSFTSWYALLLTPSETEENLPPMVFSLTDCWQWTHRSVVEMSLRLKKKTLYSQQSLPFASSYVSRFPCLSKKLNSRRKSQNQKKKKKKFSAADDRQLAANKARPISIEFSTSLTNALRVKERIFPILNYTQAISYSAAIWRVWQIGIEGYPAFTLSAVLTYGPRRGWLADVPVAQKCCCRGIVVGWWEWNHLTASCAQRPAVVIPTLHSVVKASPPCLSSNQVSVSRKVPVGLPSRCGDVVVYVCDINQPSIPTPFFNF